MAVGRTFTASFLLRLNDGASAGLRALEGRLRRLASAGRTFGAIGLVGGGLSLAGPVQQAAALETRLRDVAVTAGRTGGGTSRRWSRRWGRSCNGSPWTGG